MSQIYEEEEGGWRKEACVCVCVFVCAWGGGGEGDVNQHFNGKWWKVLFWQLHLVRSLSYHTFQLVLHFPVEDWSKCWQDKFLIKWSCQKRTFHSSFHVYRGDWEISILTFPLQFKTQQGCYLDNIVRSAHSNTVAIWMKSHCTGKSETNNSQNHQPPSHIVVGRGTVCQGERGGDGGEERWTLTLHARRMSAHTVCSACPTPSQFCHHYKTR